MLFIKLLMIVLCDFGVCTPAEGPYEVAVRLDPPTTTTVVEVSEYAPPGLSNCDEMHWYRVDAGLPARFDSLGWRESNCRNEEGVHTFCCYGYWQMWTSLHMKDSRLAPRMRACGVSSRYDLDSDTPGDKKRQACAAKALYDLEGLAPWT